MIVYNNQAPDAVNNVGQFGATEGSIGAYKQAAEYAADSKYWALLAESKFGTIDDLIAEVERLYQQGVMMKQDIEDLKQDFKDQDARLMTLVAQTNAAVSDANNAVALINQKLIEVQKQLDVLLGMSVDVTTLPPGTPATGSFNPTTGVISLGIPEGDPGKDGSVKDLDTAPTGVPELGDLGFYVDKDDNTVHKTTLENIANLIPSVRSVSINGGPALDGEVALTLNKGTVGLENVLNVAQYSRQEINDKFDKTTKTYQSKAEADADAQYRQVGEKVLVWEATKYEFYTVAADKTLTPVKTEGRILTVNSRSPDSSGNIDITIPTGNPSLYLGEMVMFPYDPTKNVSYPGVLPADGRLVSKESASDLGPSLVSGQLPVVSETEWQSGARQYFSWGKLADGITDADSTNFINIRLPDWTGGEAIRSPDPSKDSNYKGGVQSQIPYIVTVNGKAPDDASGNIVLTAANVGAAASGANSDITSLSGLTTPLSISQGGTGSTTVDGIRDVLKINPFTSENNHAFIFSPNLLNRLVLRDDGYFIIQERSDTSSDSWVPNPISIESGGTGADNAGGARINLGLNRFYQNEDDTWVIAPDNASYLTVSNSLWGVFNSTTSEWRPLEIGQGGTGATTVEAARTNLGLGTVATFNTVPVANGGTGATTVDGARGSFRISQQSGQYGSINNLLTVFNNALPSGGVISFRDEAVDAASTYQFGSSLLSRVGDTYATFSVNHLNGNLRVSGGGVSGGIATTNYINNIWGSRNTTVDVNGFIKQASPIVKIFGNGEYETNIDAEGVTVKRLAEGVYEVSGCLGLNSDASWGGVDGGFEIPIDRNKQPRVWLDYEIKEDGSILVKTYHRTHPTSPVFARNEIEGFSDGDPIDIPSDAFISVRVEMPSE